VVNVAASTGPALASFQIVLALVPFVSIGEGTASGIADPREVVVRSEQEWKTLWRQHAPSVPLPPPVDFTKEIVVGVFAGQRPTAGYRVEIFRVERESRGLSVVYRVEGPAKDAMLAQMLTQPFKLVRLPGLGLPVRFKRL
jgi:hypothetical protein